MATNLDQIKTILSKAGIRFELDENGVISTVWSREDRSLTVLIFALEQGELVQLRVPGLLQCVDDSIKPLLFRAMLQMAYEIRLVQFEYDPRDGEVSTSVDIALEDSLLTADQLVRCCSLLLDVSFLANDRLQTILTTGRDPALDTGEVDAQEAQERQSQLDVLFELAKAMRNSGGDA